MDLEIVDTQPEKLVYNWYVLAYTDKLAIYM